MEWSIKLLELPWETLELLRAGGKIILPIACLSLCMWFLILRKLIELRAARREQVLFQHSRLFIADELPKSAPDWLAKLLAEFSERRSYDEAADKQLLDRLLKKKSAEIEKYVPTILVLASIAPLLGLLGTVTGMISTFDAISQVGTGSPRPLAAGISEALITTQCGLAVAIPGLIIGSYLNRRVEQLRAQLENLGFKLYRLYQSNPINSDKLPGEKS